MPASATNIIAIAGGSYHSLALKNDGTVIAWGRNADGQTNVPTATTNVVAIASGQGHSVALKEDGTIVAWGNNEYGQTNVPIYLNDGIAVASGYYHNLALRSDHTVVIWGSQYLVPNAATNVVAIAAGWEHSLALRADGTIVAWGDNSYGQSTVPNFITNAVAIAAGYGHSLALLSDGQAVAWGKNRFGVTNVPAGLHNVAAIASGEDHDLAMVNLGPPRIQQVQQTSLSHVGGEACFIASAEGTYPMVFQWQKDAVAISGATNRWLKIPGLQTNHAGAYNVVVSNIVGLTTSDPANLTIATTPFISPAVPTQVNALVGSSLCLPAVGTGAHPLYFASQLHGKRLMDDGRISGANSSQLCINPLNFQDSGSYSVVAMNDFGSVTGLLANIAVTPIVVWGDNSAGQYFVPPSATNVVVFAGGDDHSLVLRDDGTVVAWGDNTYGQNNVPPSATGIVAIADGITHCLALKMDGSVIAWGDNSYGQTNVPTTAKNVVAIAAGWGSSRALRADGSTMGWGSSAFIVPGAGVLSISSRGINSLALRSNGMVFDWNYLLGNTNLTNPVAIAAGESHAVALQNDGTVITWGNNRYGQTNTPASATNITAIAAGDDYSMALRRDGNVIAWGNTNFGQGFIPTTAVGATAIAAGSVHCLALIGQSLSRTIAAGESAFLTAGNLGGGRANYQWQFNGTNLVGATNVALVLTGVHWQNAGTYQVVVSNALGVVTGQPINLSVKTPFEFDNNSFAYLPDTGAFQMRLVGSSGTNPVAVYASSNLLDWEAIFTNPPSANPIDFTDTPAPGFPQRFYRAVELP